MRASTLPELIVITHHRPLPEPDSSFIWNFSPTRPSVHEAQAPFDFYDQPLQIDGQPIQHDTFFFVPRQSEPTAIVVPTTPQFSAALDTSRSLANVDLQALSSAVSLVCLRACFTRLCNLPTIGRFFAYPRRNPLLSRAPDLATVPPRWLPSIC